MTDQMTHHIVKDTADSLIHYLYLVTDDDAGAKKISDDGKVRLNGEFDARQMALWVIQRLEDQHGIPVLEV